ncbi:hypothetical protein BUALT_Bualt03G0161200 [Buddleja alternifolia]|uniref:Reverse transcriptase zinc-binding domain-containing protein n=1 Tax=Buddleja alternifolia TaxID=168488 RepID=A0AAV6Y0U9_9LAMI|nr:hypothetical protein BUALT_Bualt03G0161200 [Buddleja alternifolia]
MTFFANSSNEDIQCTPNDEFSFSVITKIVADRPFNNSVFKATILKAWNPKGPVKTSFVENNVTAFIFSLKEFSIKIMENGPWSFRGFYVVTKLWDPNFSFNDLKSLVEGSASSSGGNRSLTTSCGLHNLIEVQVTRYHCSNQVPSGDNLALMEAMEMDLDEYYKKLESFWHQKSKLKWIRDGDANTKFFHMSSILHHRNNKICEVIPSNGVRTGEWKLVGEEFAKIHDRFKTFIWRILHKSFSTRAVLGRFIEPETPLCPFCHEDVETDLHLFLECRITRRLWWKSKWNFRPQILNLSSLHDWFCFSLDPKKSLFQSDLDRGEFFQFSVCLMDLVWKGRNRLIHNNECLQESVLLTQISKLTKDHLRAQTDMRVDLKMANFITAWQKPPYRWIKANFHSYFQNGSTQIACIFHNSDSSVLASLRIISNSLAQAEVETLLEMLKEADTRHIHRVICVSDCSPAVKMLLGPFEASNWDCRALSAHAKQILFRRPFWNINPVCFIQPMPWLKP